MLLQQLKLFNVRSYSNQIINFTNGSTLLSGDIGSGKSTILLAIEFALFGTSRPDLPGETLLRKGANNAQVELQFNINNNKIIICRNLKKEKNNVKQTSGYLIVNDIKRELTAMELKAEIINLLGYPEEFLTKNKNYIFRYTIYTPQEEMKLILQESQEIRLDVLRKVFNVDKYKNVRENLQIKLKQMRNDIAVLNTKTENFNEQQQKMVNLEQEETKLTKLLNLLMPQLEKLKLELQQNQINFNKLEISQDEFKKLQQKQDTIKLLLIEKERTIKELTEKKKQLQVELNKFTFAEDTNIVQSELIKLQQQKDNYLTKKAQLHSKLEQLQNYIKNLQEENLILNEQIKLVEEKKSLENDLLKKVSQKNLLNQKKDKLNELWEKISELIVKNQTILLQSRELQNKIVRIDNCPTCLQEVSLEHKNKIHLTEQSKIKQAEKLLAKLYQKKKDLSEQKEQTEIFLQKINRDENILVKTRLELEQLNEKTNLLSKNKQQLKNYAQQNNLIIKELENFSTENNFVQIEQQLIIKRNLLEQLQQKKLLIEQIKDWSIDLERNISEKNQLINNLKNIELNLNRKEDLTLQIKQIKISLQGLIDKDKELSMQQIKLITELKNLRKNKSELQKIIYELTEQKNKLIRLKELYHWLDCYFLKLTYTLEKQVMLNIHQLFNSLFKDWFTILIDDDDIYATLDDTFTPVIEQNGYEISFNNLSGGEKTSAALAYRLALNKVINDVISGVNTKDLLILDEPTDGFSTEQLDKVRDVLEKLNLKQIIIVSHESKIESFVENVIRIEKNGHISKVI